MKITEFILKITALILTAAAVICLVMANMDRISDWLAALWAKVQAKKERLCRTCPGQAVGGDDEFEDWDI
ncbi:MAG TPA: hypothetical protein H9844_08315 [Candidatus Evtepia faecigallinarum]|nr:hypothetical protein [Candidatus Evtepia faecigallinarum]